MGSVCPCVCKQDFVKVSRAVFVKDCGIVDYGSVTDRYRMNRLQFAVGPTHSGQIAAIFDFC